LDSSPAGPSAGNADDAPQEYAAARSGAATFELTGWTQVDLDGADRAKFLHNFCTNDTRGLAPGRGCEAFITSVRGKVLAHVFVYAGEATLRLVGAPGNSGARIIQHLSRYQISEDVTFADRTEERGLLLVAGPQAAIALANLGCGAPGLASGPHGHDSTAPFDLEICRNDLLGVSGFLVSCPAGQASALAAALDAAGAQAAQSAVFDALRIEASFPMYGIDITDENLAQEVNRTAQAISFSKGCYLGQEPIARIDALGHVNHQLRGIRLGEGPVPPSGAEIFSVEGEPRKIGHITSAALSFGTNLPVALGYLKRHFDTPGLPVAVVTGGRRVSAELFSPERP
jgi:folate-binding protein YgfZ